MPEVHTRCCTNHVALHAKQNRHGKIISRLYPWGTVAVGDVLVVDQLTWMLVQVASVDSNDAALVTAKKAKFQDFDKAGWRC